MARVEKRVDYVTDLDPNNLQTSPDFPCHHERNSNAPSHEKIEMLLQRKCYQGILRFGSIGTSNYWTLPRSLSSVASKVDDEIGHACAFMMLRTIGAHHASIVILFDMLIQIICHAKFRLKRRNL